MAASEALNFLKLTDSENTPAGTDTIGTSLDDELRSLKANVARAARWETTATVSSVATLTRTGLHKVIPLDGTTAAFDLTLPDATDGSMTGFATVFYKSDTSANAVTLNASGSQTINGALTLGLSKQYDSVMLVSDAANWHVASSNRNTLGALTVEGTASFSATAIFKAAVLMEGTLTVSGAAVMKTAFTVEGTANFGTVGTLDVTGATTLATADSTDPFAPRSYLAGLGLSNGTDSDHDIDIAAGMCRDGGDAATLRLTSAITKQIDAAWSVGDDAGGIDTGAVANNTWYAIWLIRRSDTGVVDALFSTSASSPTMPTNYDQKRRIGWVRTNGSANIIGFLQTGDTFEWTDPNTNGLDESNTAVTTSESTITLDFVPPSVESILHAGISGIELAAVWLYRTDLTSAAVTISSGVLPNVGSQNVSSGQTNIQAAAIRVRTDSSRQIHARAQSSYTLDVQSMGWVDRRGRDD